MTIKEAAKQGIARIRMSEWANPKAYLRIDLIDNNGKWQYGPWFHLYDRPSQEAIGQPTPQDIIFSEMSRTEDMFVKYTGAIDKADTAAVTL